MGAKSWDSEVKLLQGQYDFDLDGGAIGNFDLLTLPDDFVVIHADVFVETALTSGGAVTVEFGNVADPDGYVADIGAASAGLVAGAGALLSGKHLVLAADDKVTMAVGTAALTAGKLKVKVLGYQA